PLYLELEAIPELATCAAARARLADPSVLRELAELRGAQWLDYGRLLALQQPLLAALHREFAERHRDRDSERAGAYAAYRELQGALLRDFATFRALEDWLAEQGEPRDWRHWPAAYRSPRGAQLESFRAQHAEAIDYHAWVQFELDRQLAAASEDA